jgi:hypothetical protein
MAAAAWHAHLWTLTMLTKPPNSHCAAAETVGPA